MREVVDPDTGCIRLVEQPKYFFNIGDGALIVSTNRWPNPLYRFVQRWVLGIKWGRLNDKNNH